MNIPVASARSTPTPSKRVLSRSGKKLRFVAGLILLGSLPAAIAQVLNDHFADRELLVGTNVVLQSTTWGSTRETADPTDLVGNRWWTWTAASDGVVAVWVRGSTIDGSADESHEVVCWVLAGSKLESLETIAKTPRVRGGGRAVFAVRRGETYHLAVGVPKAGRDAGYYGRFDLTLQSGLPPDNDDFSHARWLNGTSVTVDSDNRVAGVEPDEPSAVRQSSVWWNWTAPSSGNVIVHLEEGQERTNDIPREFSWDEVEIFTGPTLSSLVEVPSWVDVVGRQRFMVQKSFSAISGETYHLRVSGYFGLAGRFRLHLAQTLAPQVRVVEPVDGQRFYADQLISFAAEASDLDGRVSEVEFSISSNAETIVRRSTMPFRFQRLLAPGSYRLQARASDDVGALIESWPLEFRVLPANDDFARRRLLRGLPVDIPFSAELATPEEKEPVAQPGTSVWWSWRAPNSGPVTLTLSGEAAFWDWAAGVYLGSQLTELTPLATGHTTPVQSWLQLPFDAVEGQDYVLLASGGNRLRLVSGQPPSVQLTKSSADDSYTIGETIQLRCRAIKFASELDTIVISERIGGTILTQWTNSSPEFELEVPLQFYGQFAFQATVIDKNGLRGESQEIVVSAHPPALANDDFANRVPLTGAPIHLQALVYGATSEPGDPFGYSVWWTWTPPSNGIYTISLTSPASPHFQLSTGTQLSQLKWVGAAMCWNANCYLGKRLTFEAAAGTTYVLAVQGDLYYPGPAEIDIVPGTPPSLRWGKVRSRRLNSDEVELDVAVEPFDPDGDVNRIDLHKSGELIGTLQGPLWTALLRLRHPAGFDGGWLNLSAAVRDAQGLENRLEDLRVWADGSALSNDDFADRIHVEGVPVTLSAPLQGAIGEPGRPELGRRVWWEWTPLISGQYSIVLRRQDGLFADVKIFGGESLSTLSELPLRWSGLSGVLEARAGQSYILGLEGNGQTTFEILFSAPPEVHLLSPSPDRTYRQGDLIRLEAVAADDIGVRRVDALLNGVVVATITQPPYLFDLGPMTQPGRVDFRAKAIDDQGIPSLSAVVSIDVIPRSPVNDDFAHRIPIQGNPATVTGSLKGASLESFEIQIPDVGSVWWSWRAAQTGPVILGIAGYNDSPVFEVFSGADAQHLVRLELAFLGQNPYPWRQTFAFMAVAGLQYQIRCVGPTPSAADVKLTLAQDVVGRLEILRKLDGGLRLRMADSIDRPWLIEASDTLDVWLNLGVVRSHNGSVLFEPEGISEGSRRFYRLRRD